MKSHVPAFISLVSSEQQSSQEILQQAIPPVTPIHTTKSILNLIDHGKRAQKIAYMQ